MKNTISDYKIQKAILAICYINDNFYQSPAVNIFIIAL